MNQRLYSDALAAFHIQEADHRQGDTQSKVFQFASEYSFTAHYEDLGVSVPFK